MKKYLVFGKEKVMRKVSLKTKINEKRGTGTCADYKPFIYVSESKSDGTASIITDWKHGRAIQCLSQSEAMADYVLRWDDSNVDIREQYPLSSVVTNDIREELGFKKVNNPEFVMTTDFLVSKADGSYAAYSVKYSRDSLTEKEKRNILIEKKYWESRGVAFSVIYKEDIDRTFCNNIRLMVAYYDKANVFDAVSEFRHCVAVKEIVVDMKTKLIYDKDILRMLETGEGYHVV